MQVLVGENRSHLAGGGRCHHEPAGIQPTSQLHTPERFTSMQFTDRATAGLSGTRTVRELPVCNRMCFLLVSGYEKITRVREYDSKDRAPLRGHGVGIRNNHILPQTEEYETDNLRRGQKKTSFACRDKFICPDG